MSQSTDNVSPAPLVRTDVAVIGGGPAGFGAALQLVRVRRDVVVIDAGSPRSRFADEVHCFPGLEERPTTEYLAHARSDAQRYGVRIIDGRVASTTSDGLGGFVIHLAESTIIHARRVLVTVGIDYELPPIEGLAELGLRTSPHPAKLGDVLDTDEFGATNVTGVYAAGNVVDPSQQVLQAAAAGTRVGGALHASLIDEDIERARRSRHEVATWDARYVEAEGRWWSGNPNGSLVVEVSDLTPGRALDIGCGEGADAIWLAERGWNVTAVDISPTAVARAADAAANAQVDVTFLAADVLRDPPEAASFDLVSIQYPALLHTAGAEALRALFEAVAPGGVMLIVGHDLSGPHGESHRHRFAEYASLDTLTALVPDDFDIEVNEVRPRPNPPQGTHHSDDVVLRARRRI